MTRKHEEDALQVAVVKIAAWIKPPPDQPPIVCFHVPNGGYRNPIEAKRFVAMGVLPGVPDLVFILPGGQVGFMELKIEGGKLTPPQELRKAELMSLGCRWELVRSTFEAAEVLARWYQPFGYKVPIM